MHVIIEINVIEYLGFPTIPNRQCDPHQTVKKIITTLSIRQFAHEPGKLDDLFEKAHTYSVVVRQAEQQLSPQEMIHFNQYIVIRLESLSRDSLHIP